MKIKKYKQYKLNWYTVKYIIFIYIIKLLELNFY